MTYQRAKSCDHDDGCQDVAHSGTKCMQQKASNKDYSISHLSCSESSSNERSNSVVLFALLLLLLFEML